MRGMFERLFAPSEEPSNDPRVVIAATLAAEKRIARYEAERAERMAEYARAWTSTPVAQRPAVLLWREHA